MSYIYLPVDTQELRTFAAEWNQGRIAKGKAAYHVIRCRHTGFAKAFRRINHGALRNVPAGRKLYILAHGQIRVNTRGAVSVGATRDGGGGRKSYSPDQLAAHLEAEGLTKQIRDVRLFNCQAGVERENGPAFGELFFDAMQARGYAQVEVSAYLGNLVSAYGQRGMPELDNEARELFEAAEGNVYFTATRHKGVDMVSEYGGVTRIPAQAGRVRYR